MHYDAGHMLSTFKLAKKLQLEGHRVSYLSIPDCKKLIESHGFDVVSFVEDIMPLGYMKNIFSSTRVHRRQDELVFAKYLDKITDGTLDECIKSVNADICICDPFLSYVAMRSLLLDIPTIHLFTSLFLYKNSLIAPVVSGLSPSSRLRCLMAWQFMFFKFFFIKKVRNFFTKEFMSPLKMHHLVDAYYDVAAKSGYPCKKNITYRLNEIGFNLILPEVMLCPKAFQFPGNVPKNRMYIGDFVDFKRDEARGGYGF